MKSITVATYAPGTLQKLNEIAELSDGSIVHVENYPSSLSVDIINDDDTDIIIAMIREKGLTIL
jgi:hypothetical protein